MVRVWKNKSLLFCLRYDPLIVVSKAKSHNFHFHKNDIRWPLSANGLFFTISDESEWKGLRMPWKWELSDESVPKIRTNVSSVFQTLLIGLQHLMVPSFILSLFFFQCTSWWSWHTTIKHRTVTKVSEKFERTIQKRTKLI